MGHGAVGTEHLRARADRRGRRDRGGGLHGARDRPSGRASRGAASDWVPAPTEPKADTSRSLRSRSVRWSCRCAKRWRAETRTSSPSTSSSPSAAWVRAAAASILRALGASPDLIRSAVRERVRGPMMARPIGSQSAPVPKVANPDMPPPLARPDRLLQMFLTVAGRRAWVEQRRQFGLADLLRVCVEDERAARLLSELGVDVDLLRERLRRRPRLHETDPRFAFLLAGEIACVMARWSGIALPAVRFARGLVWSWDRHERVEE